MQKTREFLHAKLVEKTEALGRQVTFLEMSEDANMPPPNDYAYYYGSFSDAAAMVYHEISSKDEKADHLEGESKGVVMMSKRHKQLSPERTQEILNEYVNMFIEAGGQMPSSRAIKKNRYVSEEEILILRMNGELREPRIRRMASEKTGKTFPSPNERRAQEQRERGRLKKLESEQKKIEEVAKMKETVTEEKMARRGVRYTAEECKEKLRKACREAKHVLTQSEANNLASEGVIPRWPTLQRQVGPWFLWSEMFNVPFSDEKRANAARKLRETYLQEEKDREEAAKRFAEKQQEPEEPVEETAEVVNDAVEEPTETPVEEPVEMVEIPITLTLPKWVKGTVRITLNL